MDPDNFHAYRARAAFQLRIQPGNYCVGPETLGHTGVIDPNFSNDVLEWMTDIRGVIILTGVLLRLEEVAPQ